MYILFILLGFIFLSILIQENYPTKLFVSKGVIVLFVVVLVTLAVLRPSTMADYLAYQDFYTDFRDGERYEPTAKFFRNISPFWVSFLFIYAVLGIGLKLNAIKKYSVFPLLSVLTYLSTSFVLHDLIQIRVSCAIGIFLCSIHLLVEKKYLKYFLYILVASLFHISALVYLVFLFTPVFNTQKMNKKFWIVIIFISYLFYFLNIDLLSIFLAILSEDTHFYVSLLTESKKISKLNPLNLSQLSHIMLYFLLLIKLEKQKPNTLTIILLKIFATSIITVPVFSSVAVLGFRVSEMLAPVIIFLLPNLIYTTKKKSTAYFLSICGCFVLLYINVIRTGYLF